MYEIHVQLKEMQLKEIKIERQERRKRRSWQKNYEQQERKRKVDDRKLLIAKVKKMVMHLDIIIMVKMPFD